MSKRTPKSKAAEGEMLTHNTIESVSSFETTETVAVMEPDYGDVTTAALADVEKDKKMWRSLVMECAEGKTTPPDFLLKRLAPAVGLSELVAETKFQEDVLAIVNLRKSEETKTKYEEKKAAFIKEHADEKTLQDQLAVMLQQTKDLRSLINEVQNIDRVIGKHLGTTRRIGAAFTRVF